MSDSCSASEGSVVAMPDAGTSMSSEHAPSGYGARLAWERQRVGLGVTDVAASLRLHPNQVRAIEQEDLTRLPELAYVRGFIRSYARVVNVDPAPILSDLNAKLAPAPVADNSSATNYSMTRGVAHERTSVWVVAVAVLGLIALGVLGWQATHKDVPVTQIAAPVSAPILPATPAPVDIPSAPSRESTPAATATEPFPPQTDSRSDATAAVTAVAPLLVLRFNGLSWTEVTDAKGKVLLSQLSEAGAEHGLDGELPLTVVIGDANKAVVEVRGEAFNLAPFTRNNVARFAVN